MRIINIPSFDRYAASDYGGAPSNYSDMGTYGRSRTPQPYGDMSTYGRSRTPQPYYTPSDYTGSIRPPHRQNNYAHSDYGGATLPRTVHGHLQPPHRLHAPANLDSRLATNV